MKLLHPCLSLASLWMVPQLWFIFFISTATALCQVVFGRPSSHLPYGVQWIATLVMELASLSSMCPIRCHRFLVMMGSISSCWHFAERSRLEMVLGHIALYFPEACRMKGRQLGQVMLSHLPALWSIQKGRQYAALVELQPRLDAVLWWPPDCSQTPKGVPGFAQFALNDLVGTSILSDNTAKRTHPLCLNHKTSTKNTDLGKQTTSNDLQNETERKKEKNHNQSCVWTEARCGRRKRTHKRTDWPWACHSRHKAWARVRAPGRGRSACHSAPSVAPLSPPPFGAAPTAVYAGRQETKQENAKETSTVSTSESVHTWWLLPHVWGFWENVWQFLLRLPFFFFFFYSKRLTRVH